MWSSRLFWKLFLSYAALNLLATLTFVIIVAGWQQQQVVEQVTQRLRASAVLVRSDVLGERAAFIETVRGIGYRFREPRAL